jgi:hypothetical protein
MIESPIQTSNSLNMSSALSSSVTSSYHMRASTRRSSALSVSRLALKQALQASRRADTIRWWSGLRATTTKTSSDTDAACGTAIDSKYAHIHLHACIISYLHLLYGTELATLFKTRAIDNPRLWRNYERVARRMALTV